MLKVALGGFDLFWDIQTSGFTPLFMPQVSSVETEGWQDLMGAPVSIYMLHGVGPKRLSFQEEALFRIKVLNGTKVVDISSPETAGQTMNRHDWLIYREMIRREALELNKYTGSKGVLLRRIIYGTRCPNCTSEILGDCMSDECAICYGTAFDGGYYQPIYIKANWADEPSAPNNTTLEASGPSELRVCDAVFPAYPTVKFKDIYIETATNHRHEIQSVIADEYRGGTIRQIVTMSRLPISDPVYQFEISANTPSDPSGHIHHNAIPSINPSPSGRPDIRDVAPVGNIDSVNKTFYVPGYFTMNIEVVLNGLTLRRSDFTCSLNGAGIVFTIVDAPIIGDELLVNIYN